MGLLVTVAVEPCLNLLVDAESLSSKAVVGDAACRVPVDTIALHNGDGQEPEPGVVAKHLLPIATLANVEGVFGHRLRRVALFNMLNGGDIVQRQVCVRSESEKNKSDGRERVAGVSQM